VQRRYPVNSEDEARIKAGEPIRVFRGDVSTGFPNGIELPEGSSFKILEP
jgi:hypothetical protein